jgi:hypothetical protein
MTTEEAEFVPTFSHQPLPAEQEPEPDLVAPPPAPSPYAALGDAVELATAAMTPTFDAGPGNVAADRLRRLRHVRDEMPGNTQVPTGELRSRSPAKLLPLADGWDWDGPNLLVLGPTRVGKTSGVALLVRLLMERSARASNRFSPAQRKLWGGCSTPFDLADLIRWQSCRDLTSAVREFPLGQGTPETIQRCAHARLLVLDDVGGSDDRGALERILNARYERRWPTIVTSGLTSRELVAAFGEALVRRMGERAGQPGIIVNLFNGQGAQNAG